MHAHEWSRRPSAYCSATKNTVIHQLPAVTARLGYLKPTAERPYEYAHEPPAGTPWQNCEYDRRAMQITDARSFSAAPSVHREGFELWDAPSQTAVRVA